MSPISANTTRQPDLLLNSKIGAQLTIAKRIGKGNLGVVYAGVHPILSRRFAIRIIRGDLTKDENVFRRLKHVVREVSAVEHTNVVPLTDFGNLDDGRIYLTMEFVRGIPLAKVLERDGPMPIERALPLLYQLADAIEAAHRLRVIHGDIKPSNILLCEEPGGRESIRLNDFRLTPTLAEESTPENQLRHLQIYTDFSYLAPEQISNQRIDGRVDIYSYGTVAYRMLTGEPPFVGDPKEVLIAHRTREPVPLSRRVGVQGLPLELEGMILHCLEKDPSSRYKTMGEVCRLLQGLLPSKAPLIGPFEEEITSRWKVIPEHIQAAEQPLPESPPKLRQLYFDTLLELAEVAVSSGYAGEKLRYEISSLRRLKDESSTLLAQSAITENRFEDIRRESRERESTLRYAIIDLNLVKAEMKEKKVKGTPIDDLDAQLSELEQSLLELEKQRNSKFAKLKEELQTHQDRQKELEQETVANYRRIYMQLVPIRTRLEDEELPRKLFRTLERCWDALAPQQSSAFEE